MNGEVREGVSLEACNLSKVWRGEDGWHSREVREKFRVRWWKSHWSRMRCDIKPLRVEG